MARPGHVESLMVRRLVALVLPLLLAGPASAVVDLAGLSASDRRIYCYVYVSIDLEMREEAGLIDGADVTRQTNKMVGTIYRREGNLSSGVYARRASRALAEIVAEKPSDAVFASRVKICRALFGL
jgi:hypothetical protein